MHKFPENIAREPWKTRRSTFMMLLASSLTSFFYRKQMSMTAAMMMILSRIMPFVLFSWLFLSCK